MTAIRSAMEPPRKILLATDLSARCDRALDRAAFMAGLWQAQLIALHVMEQTDDFYAHELERRLPSWRQPPDARRIMEDQLRHDMMETTGHLAAIVERGKPAEVIPRVAEAQGCDLIVTGIARDEMLGRFGLGSTVDRLLRRSPIPLLIVKQRARAPYQHVVVATDFSESSRYALQAAAGYFPDQKMSVFHAYRTPLSGRLGDAARDQEQARKSAVAECAAFLATTDIPDTRRHGMELLVEHGFPNHLIQDYVRDRGVDLVVLGTERRSALLDILIGSTARDILSSLPCDALVVRAPRSPASL